MRLATAALLAALVASALPATTASASITITSRIASLGFHNEACLHDNTVCDDHLDPAITSDPGTGAFTFDHAVTQPHAAASDAGDEAHADASGHYSASLTGGGDADLVIATAATLSASAGVTDDSGHQSLGLGAVAAQTQVEFTLDAPVRYHFVGSASVSGDTEPTPLRLVHDDGSPIVAMTQTGQIVGPPTGTLAPGKYAYVDFSRVAAFVLTDTHSTTGPHDASASGTWNARLALAVGDCDDIHVGHAVAHGCFTERQDAGGHGTGVFETGAEAWVGGIDLRPEPGGMLVIEPGNASLPLRAEGAGVDLVVGGLLVPAPLGEIKPFVGSYTLGLNTVGTLERFFSLPLLKGLSGSVTVTWGSDGAGATIDASVSIADLTESLGTPIGGADVGTLSGKLALKLANGAPADISNGELTLPDVTVEIKGTDPKLKEGFGGATFKATKVGGVVEWSGAVSTFFPIADRQGSLTGRLFLRDAGLAGLGLGVTGLSVPIGGTGWFLSGVNGNVVLAPELGLDVGVEADLPVKGSKVTLFHMTGNLKALKLATDCKNGKNPFEFVGTTNAPELEQRKLGKLTTTVTFCAYVPSAKDFAFEAGISGELTVDAPDLGVTKLATAKGSATGWFHGFDFNLDGSYQLTLPVIGTIAGSGLLSSEGYAICGRYGFIEAGIATHNWLQAPESIAGCDFTPFRAATPRTAAAAAAGATQTLRVAAGQSAVAFAVHGARRAPRVRVLGPGGERFATPAGERPLKTRAAIIVGVDQLRTTYVFLRRPRAGKWRLRSTAGTIARVESANQLPDPQVKATVAPASGEQQIVTWNARAIPGQKLALIDRVDGVATTIQPPTARHAGRVRFTPQSPGTGERTIEAEVVQNGAPRDRLVVARYRIGIAPPSVKIRAARCRARVCTAALTLPPSTRRVRLELRRAGRAVASVTRAAKPGKRTLILRLRRSLRSRTATLRVIAALPSGKTATATKTVATRTR